MKKKSDKLPSIGFITSVADFIFFVFQYLPFQFLLPKRTRNVTDFYKKSYDDQISITKKRALLIDTYVTVYIVIEVSLYVLLVHSDAAWIRYMALGLAILRIIDIIQANVNIVLFDNIRANKELQVGSVVRVLVLLFLNYMELILCFGILYFSSATSLSQTVNWGNCIYFSVITQLTIGYGDIIPIGIFKMVSAVQGLLSMLFTLLILGRLVSSLPAIKPITKTDVK